MRKVLYLSLPALLLLVFLFTAVSFSLYGGRREPVVVKVDKPLDDCSGKVPGTLSYAIKLVHEKPGNYVILLETDVVMRAEKRVILELPPIMVPASIEVRGNGHKVIVESFIEIKPPSAYDCDKAVVYIRAKGSSIRVEVHDLTVLVKANATDGLSDFIAPISIAVPYAKAASITLRNIEVRGLIEAKDKHDTVAGVFTYGGVLKLENVTVELETNAPSSPYDFNAGLFLDTPYTVQLSSVKSRISAPGKVVSMYIGTPTKDRAVEVVLSDVHAGISPKNSEYAHAVWLRGVRRAKGSISIEASGEANSLTGLLLTEASTEKDGLKVHLRHLLGKGKVTGIRVEKCSTIVIAELKLGKVYLNSTSKLFYVTESKEVEIRKVIASES